MCVGGQMACGVCMFGVDARRCLESMRDAPPPVVVFFRAASLKNHHNQHGRRSALSPYQSRIQADVLACVQKYIPVTPEQAVSVKGAYLPMYVCVSPPKSMVGKERSQGLVANRSACGWLQDVCGLLPFFPHVHTGVIDPVRIHTLHHTTQSSRTAAWTCSRCRSS